MLHIIQHHKLTHVFTYAHAAWRRGMSSNVKTRPITTEQTGRSLGRSGGTSSCQWQ